MGKGGTRLGAGRRGHKVKTGSCHSVPISYLKKIGALDKAGGHSLTWNRNGEHSGSIGLQTNCSGRLELQYSVNQIPSNQVIRLTSTACHFGGFRHWFECPICSGRVGVLFMRASRFACRHCQRLAYDSQSEDMLDRSTRTLQKIESRLAAGKGRYAGKPKAMRWRTFDALKSRVYELEELIDNALLFRYSQFL